MKSFIVLACTFLALLVCFTPIQSLTVHLVSHTHDDVGWLKTVDQYFSGQNNSIQHTAVNVVLDTVVQELAANPERKFSYVEQAFFQRWWIQADDAQKDLVRSLVKNGQLEFINGGWCMHDEAASHYVDMVDQTTVGHKFLLEEFNVIPTMGWQIDPFGHSATQAALLSAEVGFDGLFFARIDYQDHAVRLANKELEMIWRASPSLGPTAQVFTGAFFSGGYGPPSGFCWDAVDCNDEAVQDDPTLEDYNVQSRVDDFVYQALQQAGGTAGDIETMNIMFTLGSDFMYEAAHEWFKNIDKIIKYVNEDGRVKALYSTPTMYVNAKNAEPVQWTVKTDDFFPYADDSQSYWTGYFTSRPALKRYIREASAFLQTVRQFEVASSANGSASLRFWKSQGVVQHHDSVSGTSKQHVAYDYAKRISIGMEDGATFINNLLSSNNYEFSGCFLKNLSVCPTTQNNPTVLAVYWNPQARNRTETLIVPVNSNVVVYDGSGRTITSQMLNVPHNQASIDGSSKLAVAFQYELDPLGATGFLISSQSHMTTMSVPQPKEQVDGSFSIQNEYIQLNFDGNSGLLVNLTNLETGVTYPFTQELAFYDGYQQPNEQDSGAYIFLPAAGIPTPIRSNGKVQSSILNTGSLVQEVQQIFSSWATQIVRLRAGERYAEFEWTVGPVDISDNKGKEVIARYNTTLQSEGKFYTDSNGREVLKRVRNERPTWKWDPVQPVAGNYYPVNGAIGIADGETTALVVALERAQGCSSLTDGSIECMVHRRLLMDDGRGVGEPLNETMGGILPDGTRLGEGLVITGSHYVHIVPVDQAYDVTRPLQDRIFQPPVPFFAAASKNANGDFDAPADVIAKFEKSFSASAPRLSRNVHFPINVELMTVQAMNETEILVRVSHQFGINEGSTYNKPTTVDLQTVFTTKITSITELSLTANQGVDNHKPLHWNTTSVDNSAPRVRVPLDGTSVTLNPLQIRTFALTLSD